MKRTLFIFPLLTLAVAAQAEPLADVLARMDRAAGSFRSYSAKMKRLQYTAVLNDSSEMDGVVRLKKAKNGIVGIVEFQQPEPRTVFVNGKSIEVFYPKAKNVEVYDATKYTSNMEQILLLGFGTSSDDLKKSYTIKDGGAQKLNGIDTTRVELTPKSAELQRLITKIEMWIPAGEATPIQVKFSEPSRNYELVEYSDTKLNPTLPEGAFEEKLPAGVKKIHPQK